MYVTAKNSEIYMLLNFTSPSWWCQGWDQGHRPAHRIRGDGIPLQSARKERFEGKAAESTSVESKRLPGRPYRCANLECVIHYIPKFLCAMDLWHHHQWSSSEILCLERRLVRNANSDSWSHYEAWRFIQIPLDQVHVHTSASYFRCISKQPKANLTWLGR